MNTLVSITVTVNDGAQNRTFEVDTASQCALVWGDAGWGLLADYYEKVKHEPGKAREVRDRTCPKARPKAAPTDALDADTDPSAVVALKSDLCEPSQWP